uniref:FAS1 domain-containing protein n=1 Tax=Eucampia antarctica TaxID=49252 RepID=A0A7S2RP38_9STRA|mmetsp:Transcript_24916/g.23921  ORF Transcript_24916/g.23921 Transcript_24916/m.23921 type:complete len:201 (+) Transcript_24916:28-630(+)
MIAVLLSFLLGFASILNIDAFQIPAPSTCRQLTTLYESTQSDSDQVEQFLEEKFPDFNNLLSKNEAVWKELKTAKEGYTIFAPNSKAFSDDTKRTQLTDPRNGELVEKVGAYHAIAEPVTAKQIFEAGGLITIGGEVPTFLLSGGFFGFGGNKEQTVTINSAKLIESYEFGKCIVHEVDSFVSPKILWRYADQLRIPGSN